MNEQEKQINFDNKEEAINGLIQFRHNWCVNVAETDKTNDLVFRCNECNFSDKENHHCFIKVFINENGTEEQIEKSQVVVR